MAVEEQGRLGEWKSRSTEGIQAIDGELLLRGDVEPVDGRGENDHVGLFERLDHTGHPVLLHAFALVGKAVLASQAAADLFAGNTNDFHQMTALARSLCKCVNHGVGIGTFARAAAQYNDIHKVLPSLTPQARGGHPCVIA